MEEMENNSPANEIEKQPAEPTATEKVIESYKRMYEQEHELRLQKEKEANDLARIMTNMTIPASPPPKKKTMDELVNDLFGGKKNG